MVPLEMVVRCWKDEHRRGKMGFGEEEVVIWPGSRTDVWYTLDLMDLTAGP